MSLSPQEALVYIMVVVSASDRKMSDAELGRIGSVVRNLPVFNGFSQEALPFVCGQCADILDDDNGMQKILDLIEDTIPSKLRDTAYAVAVEIAAADLDIRPEEVRILELLRNRLKINKLTSAAIELAAQARHRVI
jgi:tellurite resistance protein